MKFIIHKGHHRAKPFSFGLWFNKKIFSKNIYFDTSCKYSIDGVDMMDTNKLFGVGYFPNHHINSARFGWRYDPDIDKITISAYCYLNGERIIKELCDLKFFTWYRFQISIMEDRYLFDVSDTNNTWHKFAIESILKSHKKKWQFKLGIFFGGNKPAPKTMELEMKNI